MVDFGLAHFFFQIQWNTLCLMTSTYKSVKHVCMCCHMFSLQYNDDDDDDNNNGNEFVSVHTK